MHYLDSSAIVKLVVPEPESESLVEVLRESGTAVASALACVEVIRAIRRTGSSPDLEERANRILDRIALVDVDRAILAVAARLEPRDLRSLDAIHLATVLGLGSDVEAIVTYDARLVAAAAGAGIQVLSPN